MQFFFKMKLPSQYSPLWTVILISWSWLAHMNRLRVYSPTSSPSNFNKWYNPHSALTSLILLNKFSNILSSLFMTKEASWTRSAFVSSKLTGSSTFSPSMIWISFDYVHVSVSFWETSHSSLILCPPLVPYAFTQSMFESDPIPTLPSLSVSRCLPSVLAKSLCSTLI